MKKKLTLLAALLAGSSFIQAANETPAPKILTVDVAEVYSNYRKAQESQDKFAASVESAQDEIKSMVDEGTKLVEGYQELEAKANNPALTEEARKKFEEEAKKKEEEIRKKEISVSQFKQQTDMTLNQRRQSLLNLHFSEIKDAVAKIAKQKNANLVFNSSGMGILFFTNEYDITADVITSLNQETSSPAAAQPAPKASGKK